MSTPSVFSTPSGYKFIWEPERIQVRVARFADDRRSMSTSCEITVSNTDAQVGGHLHQARLNLTSTTARRDLIRALNAVDDAILWNDIVETICVQSLALHRQGEPAQIIGNLPRVGTTYRVWPLCPDGMPTIIFGEGGTGKSFLALLVALMVQSGRPALGMRPVQGNILYLDYETSADEVNDRASAICAGLGWPTEPFGYRYCYQALADDLETLEEMIADMSISFLVIDSLGMACGGDPSDQALALRMMSALREMKRSALLIDHMPKNQQSGDKTSSPFGSVYKTNLARSVWMLRQGARDGQETRIGLYHKKVNSGPLRRPYGLAMRFFNNDQEQLDKMTWRTFDVAASDDEDLVKSLSLGERIVGSLRLGAMTPGELASDLDAKEPSIRRTLARMGPQVVKVGAKWGLAERRS